MDKSTLSNYGWIVIAVLVLAVMIALATPFGSYIKTGVENTTQGLFDTSEKALNVVGMSAGEGTFGPKMLEGDGQVLNAKKPVAFSFRSSAPVDTFEAVKVDGETVASENYTVTEGSTIVTFTEQYAQTLAEGNHSVEIVSNDGYGEKSATASFSVELPQLTTLTPKTWDGFTNFSGRNVWTDGTNTYYSNNSQQYILQGSTWEKKTWKGLTSFNGMYIWTDGTNTYYSDFANQYVLKGDTWEKKTWNGLKSFSAAYIWTDGTNYYYSNGLNQYVLQNGTWVKKTWNGLTSINAHQVWTDGINIYYSNDDSAEGTTGNYILKDDTWEKKTWNGLTNFRGVYVWTDGTNTYHSQPRAEQYVLNGDTWEKKTWNGLTSINAEDIWTDGTNYYYSQIENHYVFS